jgi:hypothetical protein
MAEIVEQHGRLTELMQKVTATGKAPRSFACKYLHFYHPVVPLFDDYVQRRNTTLVRWDSGGLPFPRPPHSDPQYWDYCIRFYRLDDACRRVGVEAAVKMLDAYL